MAKKSFDYFDKMTNQMLLCRKAAQQLVDMFDNFTEVETRAQQIHDTEHEGDAALHEIMNELNRSFITPIDREDIVNLASKIDDINDLIEDVANLFDMLNISEVKQEAKMFADLIMEACEVLCQMMSEFVHFKNSKKLKDFIVQVNHVEEDGDRLYHDVVKTMYQTETNAIELMKWKEIFDMMEAVLDNCEDTADLLDGLVIKNS